MKDTILLTGATGLLGGYLLRELLRAGRNVAVLARGHRGESAPERIATLLGCGPEALPRPTVLEGDLTRADLGLTTADRRWLARRAGAVVHAAACTQFRATPDGEPGQTNVGGTQELLRLADEVGIPAFHHVSTAYVCGRRRGPLAPTDLDACDGFHNPYEESKHAAERAVRAASSLKVTVYRPAIIVGDSSTGYTCTYSGLYRFLELAERLAQLTGPGRALPLRLPLSGDEPCNLVPVDWVARALVAILQQPHLHGQSYHLTACRPTPVRVIYDTAMAELGVHGVTLTGRGDTPQPSRLEAIFHEGVADYWPYLQGSAAFCPHSTAAALPHLPPPVVDRTCLRRLIRFAQADHWGRRKARRTTGDAASCAHYFEVTFPRQAWASALARTVGLDVLAGFDVSGPGGGQWSCCWSGGQFRFVRRGIEAGAVVVYRMDLPTFWAIVRCELSPQQAFFEQRVGMIGDLETGLKLAILFEQFLNEQQGQSTEVSCAVES